MLKSLFSNLSKEKNSYSKINQLRYLSQSALIEETIVPSVVRTILIIISAVILSLVVWAGFTSINEIAATEGEIIPINHVQAIQHLEGGIVSEINVSEGELVKKNQTLIKLDSTGLEKDLAALTAKKLFLSYQSIRLKAFINNTQPNFEELGKLRNNTIEEEQMKIFNSMMKAKETEREVIAEQITQKEEFLNVLSKKRVTFTENLKLISEERDLKKKLMETGRVSKFRFFDIQRQLNQVQGDLTSIESEISQAENAIDEYQNRLESLDAKAIDNAYQQLNQSDTELQQVTETIQKLEDKINRLEIKSPSYGYVKGLKVKTIGGVIESGKVIIEIVPLEGDLIVEAKIKPKDVGHVKIGQEVLVKVTSYEFSRYGSVKGILEDISATTFIDEDGTRYYLGRISLEKNYVGNDPQKNILIPGMTVVSDIITGNKTILTYLLKPIRKSITSAFTER